MRWLTFSIRDLLWLTAVIACLAFAQGERRLGEEAARISRRQADAMVKRIRKQLSEEKLVAEHEALEWKALYETSVKDREENAFSLLLK
ncbi:MAG TPA: hypothetical protein VHD36_16140 [Pirellulales bacterium]|nr:hypothetical protein [Pirellulales bacterium]